MIRVTIELVSAITGKTSNIGRMLIINDGTGSRLRGNYKVLVLKRGSDVVTQRSGRVENFPRLSYNVWRLVSRALRGAFSEEK